MQSGCTWTPGSILGVPGNDPMCDHRARTLREAGLRERFEQVSPAPGEPFDQGLWRLAIERWTAWNCGKRLAGF